MLKEMFFIVISIFLVDFINAAAPNSNGFDREQLDFIGKVNTHRKDFAAVRYTVDMQKLVWNKDLQDLAEKYDVLNVSTHSNLRSVMLPDYSNPAQGLTTESLNIFDEYCAMKKEISESSDFKYKLELLNPLQTIIGCAKKTETELRGGYTVLCYIGPSTTVPMPSCCKSPSICTSDVFKLGDELCSNPDIPDSDQLMYINALNEERRQIADKENTSNMYELVWNKSLLGIALNIVINKDPLPQDRKWRITMFAEFENGLDYRPDDETKIPFPVVGQKDQVSFKPFKDQFRPLQREIACVPLLKKWWNTYNYLCLLGPEAEKGTKEEGEIGSKCLAGFVNNNGLCSIPKTPTIPPESQVLTPSTKPLVCNPTDAVTSGTTQHPLTRYTTEKLTPEPRPQLPKELEDYEEIDGDEYDPDFPTQPPRKYYFY